MMTSRSGVAFLCMVLVASSNGQNVMPLLQKTAMLRDESVSPSASLAPTATSVEPTLSPAENATTLSPTPAPSGNTTDNSSPPSFSQYPSMVPTQSNSTGTPTPTSTIASIAPSIAPTNSAVPTAYTPGTVPPATNPPTVAPIAPPVAPPTMAPTVTPAAPSHGKHRISVWRIIGKTIAWLIIIALSSLAFGACMTNRYRIYYYARSAWYSFLRLRHVQWVVRKLRLERFFGTNDTSLNEIIFDHGDMSEGLLMQDP